MAYQSQTYSNNNSGYYIQSAATINPSSVSALYSPVEFLFNSTIQGAYFASVTQSASSFTITENETVGLSTINALIMNPVDKVTQMFVRDKTNVADQPIIQQWTPVSTIVNGVFKAGNENLNDEANAYYIQNTSAVTTQGQADLRQRTNLPTTSTRFDNVANDPFTYVEIDQALQTPNVVVRSFNGYTQINTSSITLSGGTPGFGFTDRTYLTYNTSPPNQTVLGSARSLEIETGSVPTLITATFSENGTVSFLSTITAPNVSTIVINSNITNSNISNTNASNLSTIATSLTNPAAVRINASGTTDILSTLTAPSASIPQMSNVSSINALPIADYLVTVPVGTIINWVGNIAGGGQFIPTGYLLCDGAAVLIATYPVLYAVIGNTFGPQPSPTTFALPDTRGRTLMGSLTLGNSVGANGPYQVFAVFQTVVTVNLPASWGGGTRAVWAVSNITGQIFVGMTVTSANVQPFTTKVAGFINSDGLFGNTIPVNTYNVTKSYTYVIFDSGVGVGPSTGPGTPITFGATVDGIGLFPLVGNTTPFTPGCGNYYSLPQDFNAPYHTHVIAQPGSSALTGSGQRAGDWNVGGAPPTSPPQQSFSYNDALLLTPQTGPAAVYNLPYNFAMWQLIKCN